MLKLGLIGCGRIMENGHVPALKKLGKNYQVVAVSDPSEERTKAIGDALGIDAGHRYSGYQEMLDKESLDIVDIATPHFLHKDPAVAAAGAKAHVITEKPVARNLAEADEMLAACSENGVRLAVLHNYRYQPLMRKLFELVQSGAVGEPFMSRLEGMGGGYYKGTDQYDPTWRADARGGGGCLIDNGYHFVYIFREVMGSAMTSVYARTGTYALPIEVEDLAAVLYGYENGGMFSLQTGWCVKGGGQRVMEVYGTEGVISFSRFEQSPALYQNSTGEWTFPEVPEARQSGFEGIFADIADAFERDRELTVDGLEARRNLEAIETAYNSGRTGQAIKVNISPPGHNRH